jgi:hypothetical protein
MEFQPQSFLMLGPYPDISSAVIWVTSQFGGPTIKWWLNANIRGQVPRTFTKLVESLKKTTLMSDIRDNAINSLMALNQVNKTFQE